MMNCRFWRFFGQLGTTVRAGGWGGLVPDWLSVGREMKGWGLCLEFLSRGRGEKGRD